MDVPHFSERGAQLRSGASSHLKIFSLGESDFGDNLPALAEQIEPSERVDESYKILTNIRNTRFNEMEYSVPLHNGAACLKEVLKTIADRKIDVVFPLEYRYVSRDDSMLSMSSGDEDHAHRIAGRTNQKLF